ncbi:MAG: S8 family serine peptidase [Anaerolineales bacterium]
MMKRSLFALSLILILTMLAVSFLLPLGEQVQAQGNEPPRPMRQRVQLNKVDLSEVEAHYGRLADRKGKIGVVVEFETEPAALLYARSQGLLQSEMSSLTQTHIAQIEEQQESFLLALRQQNIQVQELFRTQKVFNGVWLRLEARDVAKLRTLPGVKAIHPIIPKTLDHTTSVPLIGAPAVWGGLTNYQGDNIKIGIIDTGIDYIHTNFGGLGTGYATQDFTSITEAGNLFPTAKVVGGYDFVGDNYDADSNSTPVPDPDPMDCNGHGSHVAGTAAGFGVLTDGSTYQESGSDTYANLKTLTPSQYIAKFRIGPGGAPKAKLYAYRVIGCSGSTEVTEQAIEWAIDPNGDNDLSDHLDVINMSLGSSFGSEYDTTAMAANNAALAGVIVVAAAGNSGDVFYIHGSPAVARNAISVAASLDQGAVVSAFQGVSPSAIAGQHPAVEADFGPQTFNVTAAITTTVPANGCSSITNNLTGKIALIDRGSCTFVTKVKNAQTAGAVGVLVANNVPGFPFAMAGTDSTITIPSMMTTLAVGNILKTNLPATIKLTSDYRDQFTMTDDTLRDMIPSFTSRGPARVDTLLKPDVTAVGETVYSTNALTGNEGISYNGTSMAAPHVAGVMALLRQMHPAWSVAQLKALVMNTATHDLYTQTGQSGAMYTPTRIGAGRVDVQKAAQSAVIAYNQADPAQVSVSFGVVPVVETGATTDQTLTSVVRIENTSASPLQYNVAFEQRYPNNPGLTFSLLDAANNPLSNPLTVPGNGSVDIKIRVTINAAALTRAIDATISTALEREYFSEGGGYIVLTSTGSEPTLRVPVYIAPRPASDMALEEGALMIGSAITGTLSLTPSGIPVETTDDDSLAYLLEWVGESPDDPWSSGPTNAADIRYVGVTTDYPQWDFADAAVYFGVATHGKWDTPNSVEFDILIDTNGDEIDDYIVFNANQGFLTGVINDVQLSVFCPLINSGTEVDYDSCDAWYYLNRVGGSSNTNLFHNNVMTLLVLPEGIGLSETGDTDFHFYIVSWSVDGGLVDVSDVYYYDVANPGLYMVEATNQIPIWLDNPTYSPTFDVYYDRRAIDQIGSKGLLVFHTHNDGNTVEALPWGTIYLPIIFR